MFINKNKLTSKKSVLKSRSKYVFGFNGHEKSDEIKGVGNSYTAQFWEYDPRLGRGWNLDPMPQVTLSDYSTLGNNPVNNVDIKGNYFWGYWILHLLNGNQRENLQREPAVKLKIFGSGPYL